MRLPHGVLDSHPCVLLPAQRAHEAARTHPTPQVRRRKSLMHCARTRGRREREAHRCSGRGSLRRLEGVSARLISGRRASRSSGTHPSSPSFPVHLRSEPPSPPLSPPFWRSDVVLLCAPRSQGSMYAPGRTRVHPLKRRTTCHELRILPEKNEGDVQCDGRIAV